MANYFTFVLDGDRGQLRLHLGLRLLLQPRLQVLRSRPGLRALLLHIGRLSSRSGGLLAGRKRPFSWIWRFGSFLPFLVQLPFCVQLPVVLQARRVGRAFLHVHQRLHSRARRPLPAACFLLC